MMIHHNGSTRRTTLPLRAARRRGHTPAAPCEPSLAAGASRRAILPVVLAAALLAPLPASAQVEIEVDPFAYALNGYSFHVASVMSNVRFSVGTFGIDVPRFFHGQDDWSVTMRGIGVKGDLLGSDTDGFFVGADAGYMRMSYSLDGDASIEKRDEFTIGLRGGYRLPMGSAGLYLAPWVGIGYTFGDDVMIGERTFHHSPINVFPTVHVGWRF